MKVPFANLTRREWGRLRDLAAWMIAVGVLAAVIWVTYRAGGQDFRGYYAAATVLSHGGDPFEFPLIAEELVRQTGFAGNNPYYYPPWLALLFIPFSMFPLQVARLLWLGANIAFACHAFVLLRRILRWPTLDWRGAALVMLLAYPIGMTALRAEQISIFLAWCLIVALWAIHRNRAAVCGLALAMLLTKPNVTFFPLAIILLWLIGKRLWRPVTAFLFATGGLVAVSTWAVPGWWTHLLDPSFGAGWRQELTGPGTVVGQRVTATLIDWLSLASLPSWAAIAAYGLLSLVAIWLAWQAWRGTLPIVQAAQLGCVVGFLITPYAMDYDYALLALPIALLLQAAPRRPALHLAALLLWVAFYTIHLWGHWMSDAYWMPLILLALTVVGSRRWNGSSGPSGTRLVQGQTAIDDDVPSTDHPPPYPFRV
jgi:alpha-1,2-mannosyltransferase